MSEAPTLVMGILNVTPDSFSDGGKWDSIDAAIAHGIALSSEGADLVDVGGESTRPGARRVAPEDEAARVIPVIAALATEGIRVSVDTMRATTAEAAIGAGAGIINDVSGGLADQEMGAVVAGANVDFVAMHWRSHSETMDAHDVYQDVVAEVRSELAGRVSALMAAGVDAERIILDPGLGFAKIGASNWPLLAHLDTLKELGHRILVGASRKRFVGAVLRDDQGPEARDDATTAITALAANAGVWGVRAHNARAAKDAVTVVSAWHQGLEA